MTRIKLAPEYALENLPVCKLDRTTVVLSARLYHCLTNNGIRYLDQVKDCTVVTLFKMKNLGRKSVDELVSVASSYGITIKDDRKYKG